jgi:hypothetical protein
VLDVFAPIQASMDRVSANPACYGHRNATMILIA